MNIQYKNGLLYTSVEIFYKGRKKIIDDTVIDTGASVSMFSPDIVYDLEIYPEEDDEISTFVGIGGSEHHSFSKKIDSFKFNKFIIKDIQIDFGTIDSGCQINGLLGLDILIAIGAVIDLKEFKIF